MVVDSAEDLFIDDLGINLKPARAMGMTTIKLVSGAQALAELSQQLELPGGGACSRALIRFSRVGQFASKGAI